MTPGKRALIISQSVLVSDPRVRREIDWFAGSGWTVDTLGLGEVPDPVVRDHFALGRQAGWVRSKLGVLVIYGLLRHRTQFRLLTEDRIPIEAERRTREGEYDLVFFNDTDLIPWIGNSRTFGPGTSDTLMHLDMHEFHDPTLPATSLWRVLTRRYYRWSRSFIGNDRFTSRTTVASRIAELYADEFGIEKPALVRNIPPFEDLTPSPVDPDRVRLVFHGLGSRQRGLKQIVDALRQLDDRFTATFMLMGNPIAQAEIKEYAKDMSDRVQFNPPAPMRDLARVVNQYDLEVMFYRPDSANLEFALPNKFFEAIQGRLGLVIGESPMMAELVRAYGNGAIVSGWTATDLADTLRSIDVDSLRAMKEASHRAARELNAEIEGRVMLATVTAPGRPA